MPFTQQDIQLKSISIHLLHYSDFEIATFLSELTVEENSIFFSFKHEKRKKQYLATRILRNQLFGKEAILYYDHGAPYIIGHPEISISHANNVAGIAISKVFPVGFDIEPISDKAVRVAHKFLSEREKEIFDINSDFEMSAIWSAKETLYKLAGRKEIIFKSDLLLEKETEDVWLGVINSSKGQMRTKLKIIRQEDTIITVNTTACEPK